MSLFALIAIFFLANFLYTYNLKTGFQDLNRITGYKKDDKFYKNLDEVDPRIKKWALKIEDKKFYHHFWIDFLAIIRAIKEDLKKW